MNNKSLISKANIENIDYYVDVDEFLPYKHHFYQELNLIQGLRKIKRLTGFLKTLSGIFQNIIFYNISHGGYIALQLLDEYDSITYISDDIIQQLCMKLNKENLDKSDKIKYQISSEKQNIVFVETGCIDTKIINSENLIICKNTYENQEIFKQLKGRIMEFIDTDYIVYFPKIYFSDTQIMKSKTYKYDFKLQYVSSYFSNENIYFDNLLNLCMIVKNAGNEFSEILKNNSKFIDFYTILDTGSTDNTIFTTRNILSNNNGNIYQEPFKNFCDTRNRCLELAGTDCIFNIMLDDSYILKGNKIRKTLEILADINNSEVTSFGININENNTLYVSYRLFKSASNVKYKYEVHEVPDIQEKNVINIHSSHIMIEDKQTLYMLNRSNERRNKDIFVLKELIEKDPDNHRHLFYLAYSYLLSGNIEEAYNYFEKRINCKKDELLPEKIMSLIELGKLSEMLSKPTDIIEKFYNKVIELDSNNPEAYYYLGLYFYKNLNYDRAFEYLKKSFEIGIPYNSQMVIKLNIYFLYLPLTLIQLSALLKNRNIGIKACDRYLSYYDESNFYYKDVLKWKNIFESIEANI